MIISLGNYSSRNRFSKCLHDNLLKYANSKPFDEILFEVNSE